MKRNISKISSSVILAVLFVFIGDCRPGDEDPEDGSSLAQILMVSNINGSVWHGRPLWNSCEYTPGSITGISSCLVFENAYTKLYNSEPHNMSVVLTLNGA
ncbi:MAG: hypothetical protein OEZ34_10820, partial [Spirochaetia bacterium]|nr:hypothetical protein [Spirochaetia bacterium]